MPPISDSSSLFHDMLKPFMVIVVVLILLMFVSGPLLGQFSSQRLIGSKGKVKVLGVGVYWNLNCTSPVYSLDWGSVEPSSMKNITVFVRNEGNEPSTLFLNTSGWSPANASNFMTLTWDYDGGIIDFGQTAKVTLTLSVSAITEMIKDFSFDIIIGVND